MIKCGPPNPKERGAPSSATDCSKASCFVALSLRRKATGIAFVIVASRWNASSNTDFHGTKWFETTTNLKQSPAKFSASPPFLLNFSAQPASNLRALWRNCALCILQQMLLQFQCRNLLTWSWFFNFCEDCRMELILPRLDNWQITSQLE